LPSSLHRARRRAHVASCGRGLPEVGAVGPTARAGQFSGHWICPLSLHRAWRRAHVASCGLGLPEVGAVAGRARAVLRALDLPSFRHIALGGGPMSRPAALGLPEVARSARPRQGSSQGTGFALFRYITLGGGPMFVSCGLDAPPLAQSLIFAPSPLIRATAKSQIQYVHGPKLGTLPFFGNPAIACGMASWRKKVKRPHFAQVARLCRGPAA